jgi:hypothetical protein
VSGMNQSFSVAIVPTITAFIGLLAGLLAPLIASTAESRRRRREDQRLQCDEILSLFKDVSVYQSLTAPDSGLRRRLLLGAVRLQDTRAREVCWALADSSAMQEPDREQVLAHWTDVIREVSRVYRTCS